MFQLGAPRLQGLLLHTARFLSENNVCYMFMHLVRAAPLLRLRLHACHALRGPPLPSPLLLMLFAQPVSATRTSTSRTMASDWAAPLREQDLQHAHARVSAAFCCAVVAKQFHFGLRSFIRGPPMPARFVLAAFRCHLLVVYSLGFLDM